jgi:hypothetical protein
MSTETFLEPPVYREVHSLVIGFVAAFSLNESSAGAWILSDKKIDRYRMIQLEVQPLYLLQITVASETGILQY